MKSRFFRDDDLAQRPDWPVLARWIKPEARVLDLGCGQGQFLTWLGRQQAVRTVGVEVEPAAVLQAMDSGLDVIQTNLEAGLGFFGAASFDVVVLSKTLQAIHHTETLLLEMMRVGREGVVSFPNFGHYQHWLALMRGRMPVSHELPYQWYDSPNVHFCTCSDFEQLCQRLSLRILERVVFDRAHRQIRFWPNARGQLVLYRFTK